MLRCVTRLMRAGHTPDFAGRLHRLVGSLCQGGGNAAVSPVSARGVWHLAGFYMSITLCVLRCLAAPGQHGFHGAIVVDQAMLDGECNVTENDDHNGPAKVLMQLHEIRPKHGVFVEQAGDRE